MIAPYPFNSDGRQNYRVLRGILWDISSRLGWIEIQASEMETAPNVGNEESSKYIQGVYSHEERLLILVDLNELFSEEEWGELTTL